MSSGPLLFYFDFISHNAFLAWTQIHELAARYQRSVEPVPVLFAGLLEAHGQRGPAEIPAKRAWMLRDVLRKGARLGLGLQPPLSHPFNPLLGLRLASLPLAAQRRRALVDRLFRAAWCESLAIYDPTVVTGLLAGIGLDGPALVTACNAPDIKQALRAQTEAAVAAGVFGVPSVRADAELFWGYDDLPHLESFLRGDDPLDHSALSAWLQVPVSAVRSQR
jgi:2-hydroxychromene-2-carboxylate isomerase